MRTDTGTQNSNTAPVQRIELEVATSTDGSVISIGNDQQKINKRIEETSTGNVSAIGSNNTISTVNNTASTVSNTVSTVNNSISGINETATNTTKPEIRSAAEIEDEESNTNGYLCIYLIGKFVFTESLCFIVKHNTVIVNTQAIELTQQTREGCEQKCVSTEIPTCKAIVYVQSQWSGHDPVFDFM